MNVKKYLVSTCTYRQYLDSDSDEFGTNGYGEPETLKCFFYDSSMMGQKTFIIKDERISNYATKSYIVLDKRVKAGDLVNNQVVSTVYDYVDLNGRFKYKRVDVV